MVKCSKIPNTFLFQKNLKQNVGSQGWNSQMLVRIATRELFVSIGHFDKLRIFSIDRISSGSSLFAICTCLQVSR